MKKELIAAVLFLFFTLSCQDQSTGPGTKQQEIDEVYTLLAYAVVLSNWQSDDHLPNRRGHNIG